MEYGKLPTIEQSELGGVHSRQNNLMKHHALTTIRFCILLLVSMSLVACHHSPTGPSGPGDPPPTPAGFIACAGNYEYYCVIRGSSHTDVWYAFWKEAPDSSSASLIAGLDVDNRDTLLLQRDSSSWYFVHDGVFTSPAYVAVTRDSVIVSSLGVDCGWGYYLKKLN